MAFWRRSKYIDSCTSFGTQNWFHMLSRGRNWIQSFDLHIISCVRCAYYSCFSIFFNSAMKTLLLKVSRICLRRNGEVAKGGLLHPREDLGVVLEIEHLIWWRVFKYMTRSMCLKTVLFCLSIKYLHVTISRNAKVNYLITWTRSTFSTSANAELTFQPDPGLVNVNGGALYHADARISISSSMPETHQWRQSMWMKVQWYWFSPNCSPYPLIWFQQRQPFSSSSRISSQQQSTIDMTVWNEDVLSGFISNFRTGSHPRQLQCRWIFELPMVVRQIRSNPFTSLGQRERLQLGHQSKFSTYEMHGSFHSPCIGWLQDVLIQWLYQFLFDGKCLHRHVPYACTQTTNGLGYPK